MTQYNKNGIFFSFCGPVTEIIVREIADILKQKLKVEDASTTVIYNVFSVVVEILQNINFYSARKCLERCPDHKNKNLGLGMIFAGTTGSDYFVLSGNLIENEKIHKLRKTLEKIREMDKKELRKYYKMQLRNLPDEESKGGGLGFIEVARKAGEPIEFDFQKIDDMFSFFSLQIIISRES
jgi:hypothetical protein